MTSSELNVLSHGRIAKVPPELKQYHHTVSASDGCRLAEYQDPGTLFGHGGQTGE
jgi:hypothetical protein